MALGATGTQTSPPAGGGGNLIQVQQMLRGLPDEALPNILQTGSAPPFLVAAEMKRRETDRSHYEGAMAQQAANNSTVVADLIKKSQTAGTGIGAMLQPQGGQGAPPQPGMPPPPPTGGLDSAMAAPVKFAYGGGVADVLARSTPTMTDPASVAAMYSGVLAPQSSAALAPTAPANDVYSQLLAMLANQKGDQEKARQQALGMALLQGGGAMMAGRHSNTLGNIGPGITAGADSLTASMSKMQEEETLRRQQQMNLMLDRHKELIAEGHNAEDQQYRQDSLALQRDAQTATQISDAERDGRAMGYEGEKLADFIRMQTTNKYTDRSVSPIFEAADKQMAAMNKIRADASEDPLMPGTPEYEDLYKAYLLSLYGAHRKQLAAQVPAETLAVLDAQFGYTNGQPPPTETGERIYETSEL